jgi:hypothetical protein
MAFYSNTETGKMLDHLDAEKMIDANIFQLDNNAEQVGPERLYWGFLSKTRLESMLEEPACAGIRIYNTYRTDIQSKLIAVSVTEEGDEIELGRDGESGYFVNRLKFTDESETELEELTIAHISRDIAVQRVLDSYLQLSEGTGSTKIAFASFFSAEAIRTILASQDCNGICFHVVGKTKALEPPFSHLAVAVRYSEADKTVARLGDQGRYILSENTCPDNCAPEVANRAATAGNLAARKYLISWE